MQRGFEMKHHYHRPLEKVYEFNLVCLLLENLHIPTPCIAVHRGMFNKLWVFN